MGEEIGPAHVVGDRYPLVHAPHDMKCVHMGTMSTVRQERGRRKGYGRGTQRMARRNTTSTAGR